MPNGMWLADSLERRFLHLFGQTAGEVENPAYACVSDIGAWKEHHWTATGDDCDLVVTTEGRRLFGNASLAERTVHPYPGNAELGAFRNNLLRYFRSRNDHHGLDWGRGRTQHVKQWLSARANKSRARTTS